MNLLGQGFLLGDALSPALLAVLNRAIAANLLLLAVLLARQLLKNGPKWVRLLLWVLVALRLMLPVHVSSRFSALNDVKAPLSAVGEVRYVRQSEDTGQPAVEYQTGPGKTVLVEALTLEADRVIYAVSPLVPLTWLWLLGVLGLTVYALASVLRLRRRLGEAVRLEAGVWLSDRIDTPFLLGVLRPRIYLPADLPEEYLEPVLAHERAHLRRGDQLWKLLGWLLLCVYWFHPLLWLCWFLFCRDLELSCDERVIRGRTEAERKAYAAALLECSLPPALRLATPLGFGETGTKGRLKAVLNYKKPAFRFVILALILGTAAAVFFGTDPRQEEKPAPSWTEPELSPELEQAVHEAVLEQNRGRYLRGDYAAESHGVLALEEGEAETAVWLQTVYLELTWNGERLEAAGGGSNPVLLRFGRAGGTYALTEYRFTQEGEGFGKDFEAHFPMKETVYDQIMDSTGWPMKLNQACYAQAVRHFGIDADVLCDRLLAEVLAAEGAELRDRIRNAEPAYRQLQYLGDYTAVWAMRVFLADGNQIKSEFNHRYSPEEELKYDLLWRLFQSLAGGGTEKYEPGLYWATGMHCWNSWLRDCETAEQDNGPDWLAANEPYGALALELSRSEG